MTVDNANYPEVGSIQCVKACSQIQIDFSTPSMLLEAYHLKEDTEKIHLQPLKSMSAEAYAGAGDLSPKDDKSAFSTKPTSVSDAVTPTNLDESPLDSTVCSLEETVKERKPAPPPTTGFGCDCLEYCMTMSCIRNYLAPNNKDSCFHSRFQPPIPIRAYIRRIREHPRVSGPALLAAIFFIYRFAYKRFPVSFYCIHRLILTGAFFGTKFCDDSHPGTEYFARLGGVTSKEMNSLLHPFFEGLDFDAFYYLEEHNGLLEALARVMKDPSLEELHQFCEEHAEDLENFDMTFLSVAKEMKWFASEYSGSHVSVDYTTLPWLRFQEDPNEFSNRLLRLKAVFSLHRWSAIMEPWLEMAIKRYMENGRKGKEEDYQYLLECAALSKNTFTKPKPFTFPQTVPQQSNPQPFHFGTHHDPFTSSKREVLQFGAHSSRRFAQNVEGYQKIGFPAVGSSSSLRNEMFGVQMNGRNKMLVSKPLQTGVVSHTNRENPSFIGAPVPETMQMKHLTSVKPYDPARRNVVVTTAVQQPLLGQKRMKPSSFKDNYLE